MFDFKNCFFGFKSVLLIAILFMSVTTIFSIDDFAGNALEVDGFNDYATINKSLPDSGTIELWVYPNSFYNYNTIFDTNSGGNIWEMWIYDNGELRVRMYNGDVRFDLNTLSGAEHWYHIAVTWDRVLSHTASYSLYVDGVLRASDNSTWSGSGSEFYLAGGNNLNDPGNCVYDELRFWDVIRTEAEIADNMYSTLDGSEIGLTNYYQFNESTGSTVQDLVGTDDMVLNNMNDSARVASSIPLVPIVSTTVASAIGEASAIAGGNNVHNTDAIVSRGVCWSTSPNPTIDDFSTDEGSGYGEYTSNLTGLLPETEYFYRAYTSNSHNTVYGEEYSFTTMSATPPVLSTTIADNITGSSATSGGEITYSSLQVTQRGVCWSTDPNPVITDTYTNDGSGIGVFSSEIYGLEPLTTYYYRAYAANDVGIGYGDEMTFETPMLGEGTIGNPYRISSLDALVFVSSDSTFWDKHYIQTADINAASTSSLNNGTGFSPIGNDIVNFTGTYDGQEYIIDSLYIEFGYNTTVRDNIGLFGYVSGAEISNIGLTNVDITGGENTGGLVGYCSNTIINNCHISGDVYGRDFTGGLVGVNDNGSSITYCYGYSGYTHGWLVGGLVGKNNNASSITYSYCTMQTSSAEECSGFVGINSSGSSISNCYTTGDDVHPTDGAGFVVINEENSTIDNCYNTKSISGEDVGGFVLLNRTGATITNCYNAATVDGWDNVEPFAGSGSTNLIYNCFFDGDITYYSNHSPATELTTSEMQTLSSFTNAGWDFYGEDTNGTDDYWVFIENDYPRLAWQETAPVANFNADISNPSLSQIVNFSNTSHTGNANCQWQWDIDGDGVVDYTTENCSHSYSEPGTYSVSLTAINEHGTDVHTQIDYITVSEDIELSGSGTEQDPYQIANLDELRFISENHSYWDAYFVQTTDIDASDTQNWNSGEGFSPIGQNSLSFTGQYDGDDYSISNLYISRQDDDYIGLFGFTQSAVITSLTLENVTISGNGFVAALVGKSLESSITECSSSGSVTASDNYVGGLVGENFDSSSISDCFSSCNVNGDTYVGGLIGKNSLSSQVTNCYSTGLVQGTNSVGGLIGLTSSSSSVTGCFWDTDTSQQNISSGGAGLTTANMQTESTYLNAGWDFVDETANGSDNIWIIHSNSYPEFANGNQAPKIATIYDVPNDQGRRINVCWEKSSFDEPGSSDPIVSYNLWIKYPFATRGLRVTTSIEEARAANTIQLRSSNSLDRHNQVLLSRDNDLWISVGATYAMGWDQYTMTATTYRDSSATEDNPSTFFVSAHTTSPFVYYCSDEMSGYSLDNIAPDEATNVRIAVNDTRTNSVTLNWDEVTQGTYQGNSYPELNGVWYNVYSSDNPDFICEESTYHSTTMNNHININISAPNKLFFKIVVSDME